MKAVEIRDRKQIEEIFEHLDGYNSHGWYNEDEPDDEYWYAGERMVNSGSPLYIFHYRFPLGFQDEPEAKHIWMIEKFPSYILKSKPGLLVIRSTEGDEWELPCDEDTDIWTAMEQYDDEHGTDLWKDIEEDNYCWEVA